MRKATISRHVTTLLVGALLALMAACANPHAAAWRTSDVVRQAGNQVDRAFGTLARNQHKKCVEAHGPRTSGYAVCIDKHKKALDAWRKQARPAVNSALIATVSAIQIAEKVKQDKPVNWVSLLRPAVCAITKVIEQWGHLLGDEKQQLLSYLGAIKGVTCE